MCEYIDLTGGYHCQTTMDSDKNLLQKVKSELGVLGAGSRTALRSKQPKEPHGRGKDYV